MTQTMNSLLQWMPDTTDVASSSRYTEQILHLDTPNTLFVPLHRTVASFEELVSLYTHQIPVNTSEHFIFSSLALLLERVSGFTANFCSPPLQTHYLLTITYSLK